MRKVGATKAIDIKFCKNPISLTEELITPPGMAQTLNLLKTAADTSAIVQGIPPLFEKYFTPHIWDESSRKLFIANLFKIEYRNYTYKQLQTVATTIPHRTAEDAVFIANFKIYCWYYYRHKFQEHYSYITLTMI
jgi:hypothetical protein